MARFGLPIKGIYPRAELRGIRPFDVGTRSVMSRIFENVIS